MFLWHLEFRVLGCGALGLFRVFESEGILGCVALGLLGFRV